MFNSVIPTFVIISLLSLPGMKCGHSGNITDPVPKPVRNNVFEQRLVGSESQNLTDTLSTLDEDHCPDLQNQPQHVFDMISKSLGATDMENLASTNKMIRAACLDSQEYRTRMHFIGETPTFIPAVKRCMQNDDVKCYHAVLKHFQSENEVNPWRLKQLPALAAQLGAARIFKELNVTKAYPKWTSWMTRAMARGHRMFLMDVDELYYFKTTYFLPEHLYGVMTNALFKAPANVSYKYDPSSCRPFPYLNGSLSEKIKGIKTLDGNPKWLNLTMTEPDQYPSVTEVFRTLKIKDVSKRRDKIMELKSRILSVLKQGIYLLDDILEYSANLHVLWQHFGFKEGSENNRNGTHVDHEDGGRSSFIQWLMDEGAPMTVNDWVTIYLNGTSRTPMELEWIKLCSKYVTGSSTATLSYRLKTRIDEFYVRDLFSVLDELPFFKDVLGADLYDKSILPSMIKFLSQKTNTKRTKHIEYYTSNGLSMAHLKRVRAFIESARDWRYKESSYDTISELERILKKKLVAEEKRKKREAFWTGIKSDLGLGGRQ